MVEESVLSCSSVVGKRGSNYFFIIVCECIEYRVLCLMRVLFVFILIIYLFSLAWESGDLGLCDTPQGFEASPFFSAQGISNTVVYC